MANKARQAQQSAHTRRRRPHRHLLPGARGLAQEKVCGHSTQAYNQGVSSLVISKFSAIHRFGFLDNFVMIVAGDSIESSMSAFITISTMAAAALGNTFSDVIGIGSSYYVERAAAMLGMAPPPLAPVQLDMPVCRRVSNLGRVLGITLGCFLGMTPLLFKDDKDDKEKDKVDNKNKQEPKADAKEKTDAKADLKKS
ncbi:transmembrane protein 65 [Leguminivora glycinivorella]|uniref:transmembrane protein 65 n=1 Tax=Leguminivora glycinivorella TaxID=1035111 RepID=UPI00200D36E1|nr:transmembrane protein 65 [Leguminivora glycinivorella]